jgi:hypothetical protein
MTREQRAQLAWQVLVSAAHNRQVLTYTIVADHIGMGAGTLAEILGCIMYYCDQQGLPPLTVLVVKSDTGLPGEGLRTLADLARDREEVFRTQWFKRLPPSEQEFGDAFRRGRDAKARVAVNEIPSEELYGELPRECDLTLVETDGRFMEARYARIYLIRPQLN